jgi:AraC-like DNA-binding protein
MSRKQLSSPLNLALLPGTRIEVCVRSPSGGGSRDPSVLLNESLSELFDSHAALSLFATQRTFDTYDGQNIALSDDWYALEFPHELRLNCLQMTMGFAYPDGGWWNSIRLEVRREADGDWQPIDDMRISPEYDFSNKRGERRPYETYLLTFPERNAYALRLIGRPGGSAQFTSLARLATYLIADLSSLPPMPTTPIPYIFRLISPEIIWELSESLTLLSGLVISFPMVVYYWDEDHFAKYHRRLQRNYQGEPDLWFLVNDTMGWDEVTSGAWALIEPPEDRQKPYIVSRGFDLFSAVVAPVLIDEQTIGSVIVDGVIVRDTLDLHRHKAFARRLGIPWARYEAALLRTPSLTLDQLQGLSGLLGVIANTIANLAHRNLALQQELEAVRQTISQKARYRHEIVRRATQYMADHLEDGIDVGDAACAVALSTPHFNRLFVSETGHSPGDFLINLRLERAKHYLTHSQMSVMDVCVALGYSPSYFSRVFKQRVGCTPGAYIERCRTR